MLGFKKFHGLHFAWPFDYGEEKDAVGSFATLFVKSC